MRKVLVVDDEPRVLHIIKNELQKHAHEFEALYATDGAEAIEVLKNGSVALLVTDLVMPNVDGLGLLSYMSRNHPKRPCIVMTGHGSPEMKAKISKENVLRFIEKPFDTATLSRAILDGLESLDEGNPQAGFTVSGLLQLLEMEQKTCLLEVSTENNGKGYFSFNEGHLIDAFYNDLKGENAAFEMIGWDHVGFQIINHHNKATKPTINRGLMSLIMEGTRRKDEATGKQEKSSTLSKQEEDNLLSQAISLAEGRHFQKARKLLTRLLKANPRICQGWVWYSRTIGSMKEIEASLKNASRISPRDPDVVEEIKKFNTAVKRGGADRVRRCPFCWFPAETEAVECQFCMSHIMIHDLFLSSKRAAKQEILEKAIERYTKVVQREQNAHAYFYLSMAYLNLERWEEALDQLNKCHELAPDNKAFAGQLQALLDYMAKMETLPKQEVFTRKSDPVETPQVELKRNKVLVVEDSATTRKVISITLSQNGYTVMEATNGLEALTKLNDERPDLVLLDIILPGMDGYKILSIMKKSSELSHIPVIMLTARDKFLDKVKGKMSGSSEYLTKPFNPEELVSKVEKYLH